MTLVIYWGHLFVYDFFGIFIVAVSSFLIVKHNKNEVEFVHKKNDYTFGNHQIVFGIPTDNPST